MVVTKKHRGILGVNTYDIPLGTERFRESVSQTVMQANAQGHESKRDAEAHFEHMVGKSDAGNAAGAHRRRSAVVRDPTPHNEDRSRAYILNLTAGVSVHSKNMPRIRCTSDPSTLHFDRLMSSC